MKQLSIDDVVAGIRAEKLPKPTLNQIRAAYLEVQKATGVDDEGLKASLFGGGALLVNNHLAACLSKYLLAATIKPNSNQAPSRGRRRL